MSLAAGSAAAVGLILVTFGVLAKRTDVAVLGVPLVLGVLWNWLQRPTGAVTATLRGADRISEPGEVSASVDLEPAAGVATVQLRAHAPGHRDSEALVSCDTPRSVRLSIQTVRTGQRPIFGIDYLEASADNTLRADPRQLGPIAITVLPQARPLRELPLPFRLQGLTGSHGSRRPGEGGDLHDVNLFTPGDRLRRIDWRATAKRSIAGVGGQPPQLRELYVRRSFATADATVMLVLDSRDDVGPDVATWGDATAVREDHSTSLDIARTAAASLARRYLEAGDRVGLEDLGRMRRPMPPAGGQQQLHRIVQRLALAQPEGEPKPRKRAPRLPAGALIIVFSTFLDGDVARLAQLWRHSGHRVLAIDTLPKISKAPLPSRINTAYRIVRMERSDRLRELARSGVELVHWEGAPDGQSPDITAEVAITALARRRGVRR